MAEPPRIDNPRALWDAGLNLLLPATKELREKLGLTEIEFRRIAHTASGKAQEVYFYRVLDEIQKAGIALLHWKEFLVDLDKETAADAQLTRVILEETIDNQSLRCRKLIELLVELILFQDTNSGPYYRDYLLIRELNQHADAQRDREEFYGHLNHNCAESMKFYFGAIREDEAQLEPSMRWYLHQAGPAKPAWELRGVRLSSFRARYAQAITRCEPAEFMCLGKSYLAAYGVSREVHFSANENSSSFSPEDCFRLADRCLLLANHALIRVAKLMGATGGKAVQNVVAVSQLDESNLRLVREVSEERHGVGDYVIARGDPARVIEVKRSKYGFVAYQVVYLGRGPMPQIRREWFAAFEVRRYISKAQAEERMNAALASLPPAAQPFVERYRDPKFWQEKVDDVALAFWEAFRASKLKSRPKVSCPETEKSSPPEAP